MRDKAKHNAYMRKWRAANRDRVNARQRRFRAEHPEKIRQYERTKRSRHRVKMDAYQRIYRLAHPEERREYNNRYYRLHRDELLAKQLQRDIPRRDVIAAYTRAWRLRNHELANTYSANRRARLRGSGAKHTVLEWLEKCELFGWCCAYCGEAKPLVRDHRVPLIRGGGNDISNIVPACRLCNGRKHAKTDVEFVA